MTLAAIVQALIGHLESNWTATPLALPNADFTPPNEVWIRPCFKPGKAVEVEKGEAGLGLRQGKLFIDLFAPLSSGLLTVSGHAGSLEAMFRRKTISGVRCGEPYTRDIGDDGNGYYQIYTVIPFHAWTGD